MLLLMLLLLQNVRTYIFGQFHEFGSTCEIIALLIFSRRILYAIGMWAHNFLKSITEAILIRV